MHPTYVTESPHLLTEDEFLRLAQSCLDSGNPLPMIWQREMLRRLELPQHSSTQ